MNKKIFELIKFSSIKKVFSAFAADKYGSWSNSMSGTNTSLGGISQGRMEGIGLYIWNSGWQQYSIPVSQRTIDNLCRAKSIDFNFKYYYTHWDTWYVNNKQICAQIGSISINNGSVYIHNGTTNTYLASVAEQNAWNAISIRQSKIIINNIEYNYPQGCSYSDANNNLLYFKIQLTVDKGGYGAQVNYVINLSDISVKW